MKKIYNIDKASVILKNFREKSSSFWESAGQKYTLSLFQKVAKGVPAYKNFLAEHKIKVKDIKSWEDFQKIPIITKKNYLNKYNLPQTCWDGSFNKPVVFTSTSGSTGIPTHFPRTEELDWQYSVLIESFLRQSSYGNSPTLVIVGFGMGVWIGGLITYKAFEIAAIRTKLPVSIITPGVNKEQIFDTLKTLAPKFDQVVLIGYPPFIKDIIDEAPVHDIDLKKINLRLLFAAESFTEKFRSYLAERTSIKNIYLDTLSIYGSADIGAMAWEASLSILIKKIALENKQIFKDLFGAVSKNPTLAQFNPHFVNFESKEGDILLTGNSALPLIRYKIGDRGDVLSYKQIENIFLKHGIDLKREAAKVGINQVQQLPFVYLFERLDFSIKLYGALIFPEHVRLALQDKKLDPFVTQKLTILTRQTRIHNQYLEVNIELKPGVKGNSRLKKQITKLVTQKLLEYNTEYGNNYKTMPKKVTPKVVLWPAGDPLYFKPGIKQSWVKKN